MGKDTMIRTAALIMVPTLLLLAGCSRAVTACEDAIKRELRSPATFEQVQATSYTLENSVSVTIEYDASNAYGTPVRSTAHCTVPFYANGKPAYSSTYVLFQT